MAQALHELVARAARQWPQQTALVVKNERLSYGELWSSVEQIAAGLGRLGTAKYDRVGVWLDKRVETIVAFFGASLAGAAFVPINPVLRAPQVTHILKDCNIRVLVTTHDRMRSLGGAIDQCRDLAVVVLVDSHSENGQQGHLSILNWAALQKTALPGSVRLNRVIDLDMAAILYTSGSTGLPKGVVLSHRNLIVGAQSVSQYLENSPEDRILSALPLSFDAGLSQITTAFWVGATVILLNYLLPRDLKQICAREAVTGLTAVPPLWFQISELDWSDGAGAPMRYFANTGGHMPLPLLQRLRGIFPNAKPYLMYGLTEAFRSTYLDPKEVDRRPGSIGKAIPNAEIMVVNADGKPCAPGEEGELVHRGALVSLGYWNDPERTAARFRPVPGRQKEIPIQEMAVWSGDIVKLDEDGFLYYVGRRDDMIKTSGYRVSSTEIEEVIFGTGLVEEAVAIGVPHPTLGHGIVVVAKPKGGGPLAGDDLLAACRRDLPLYMVPGLFVERAHLPRNPNGKIDRPALARELGDAFQEAKAPPEGGASCTPR
ncbi:MAG TPA: acyl-CoA ligase (AMP-forming), exosortase A system-associated [Bradyrhizobium sp.]|nr:acyl-CoA ligase (AMP-forming), exosortase A system-associated [Bradyrhizobium sp.]